MPYFAALSPMIGRGLRGVDQWDRAAEYHWDGGNPADPTVQKVSRVHKHPGIMLGEFRLQKKLWVMLF